MSYFELKEPPRREDRLNACIAHGAVLGEVAGRGMRCCQPDKNAALRKIPFACYYRPWGR